MKREEGLKYLALKFQYLILYMYEQCSNPTALLQFFKAFCDMYSIDAALIEKLFIAELKADRKLDKLYPELFYLEKQTGKRYNEIAQAYGLTIHRTKGIILRFEKDPKLNKNEYSLDELKYINKFLTKFKAVGEAL